jgi:hypothetical protein
MKMFAQLVILILALCLSQTASRSQSGDTSVIDKFIAGQAAREKGEEPDGIRKVLTGDLNRDGVADTAVLYTIEGQNGTNNYIQYLAVFISRKGRLVYASRTAAGGKNRRALELTSIKDNVIFLDTTDYGKKDPSCCPTIKGTTRYALIGNKLTELRRK